MRFNFQSVQKHKHKHKSRFIVTLQQWSTPSYRVFIRLCWCGRSSRVWSSYRLTIPRNSNYNLTLSKVQSWALQILKDGIAMPSMINTTDSSTRASPGNILASEQNRRSGETPVTWTRVEWKFFPPWPASSNGGNLLKGLTSPRDSRDSSLDLWVVGPLEHRFDSEYPARRNCRSSYLVSSDVGFHCGIALNVHHGMILSFGLLKIPVLCLAWVPSWVGSQTDDYRQEFA